MADLNKIEMLSAKIAEYGDRANISRHAHYLSSVNAQRRNFWFGLPVVIITAVVGTAIFGTLQENPDKYVKLLAGAISILAAILSALQTYLGFSEKASKHKEAAGEYAELWRGFDTLITKLKMRDEQYIQDILSEFEAIVVKLNNVSKRSPTVSENIYEAAKSKIGRAAQ